MNIKIYAFMTNNGAFTPRQNERLHALVFSCYDACSLRTARFGCLWTWFSAAEGHFYPAISGHLASALTLCADCNHNRICCPI
jgi:hypothetical protein